MDEIPHCLYIVFKTVAYFAALGFAAMLAAALCVRDEDLVLLHNQCPDEDDVFESDRDDGYDETGNPVGKNSSWAERTVKNVSGQPTQKEGWSMNCVSKVAKRNGKSTSVR